MIKVVTKGNILIAKPVLYDDNFYRSVILLTDHNDNGSVGFIQNKPTEFVVNDFLKELKCNYPIYRGGPVEEDNIYYLHSRPDLISNSLIVYPGLFWSGNFDDVKYVVNNGLIGEDEIRFFMGYSGWSKDQLTEELDNNSWCILKENIKLSDFGKDDYLIWQKMMKTLGGNHLLWINTPYDPTMN